MLSCLHEYETLKQRIFEKDMELALHRTRNNKGAPTNGDRGAPKTGRWTFLARECWARVDPGKRLRVKKPDVSSEKRG